MELEKAIEILQFNLVVPSEPQDSDFLAAIKLGVEALKRIKHTRDANITMNWRSLPGETEPQADSLKGG